MAEETALQQVAEAMDLQMAPQGEMETIGVTIAMEKAVAAVKVEGLLAHLAHQADLELAMDLTQRVQILPLRAYKSFSS